VIWSLVRVAGDERAHWLQPFGGKDLAGWSIGSGSGNTWGLKDGELVATCTGDYRKLGYLLSALSFSDFMLRFDS
jgi:hypothetical protein